MTEATKASHEADHENAAHGHSPWLAHHFDTPQQQFAASKLGMWIFLLTEILFFSGLFCAYAVYRHIHPEVFMDGHLLLDTKWGAINTGVLIFSSLTMALAVRAAQCDQRRNLILFLAITIACAFGFLGIKYIEYKSKWDHLLVPGQERIKYFSSWKFVEDIFSEDGVQPPQRGAQPDPHYIEALLSGEAHGGGHDGSHGADRGAGHAEEEEQAHGAEHDEATGGGEGEVRGNEDDAAHADEHDKQHAAGKRMSAYELKRRTNNVRTFVGIYFAMTGLHGLHVIIGIGVLVWILVRSVKRHFSSQYFEPVECTGLYWHLVDLIWIYLFPLLYLIH